MRLNIREYVGALIAIIVIVAFLFIVVYQIVNRQTVMLPDALLVLVSLVSGVYLGQHAATNGAYAAGATAAQAASTVVQAEHGSPQTHS